MPCHTQVSQCNTGGKPKRCVRAAATGNRRFGVSASTTAVFGGGGTLREAKLFRCFFCFFFDPKHPQIQMVGYQLNDARDDKTTPLFPSKRFQKSSVFFLGVKKVVHLAALQASSKYYKAWKVSEIVNRGEGNCNVASDSRKEKFDRGLRRGSDSP